MGRTRRIAPICLVLASCGTAPPPEVLPDPTVTPLFPPQALGEVFLLESWGTPAEDTTVVLRRGEARTVLVRRGAPDNSLYAQVTFPAGALAPRAGDSATVRLRVPPGLYGLELVTEASLGQSVELTFSYAIHFAAPAGAEATYGSGVQLERFLGIGRLEGDTTLVFLDTWRPASDVMTARLPAPGRYLVAAPRRPPGFRAIIF